MKRKTKEVSSTTRKKKTPNLKVSIPADMLTELKALAASYEMTLDVYIREALAKHIADERL